MYSEIWHELQQLLLRLAVMPMVIFAADRQIAHRPFAAARQREFGVILAAHQPEQLVFRVLYLRLESRLPRSWQTCSCLSALYPLFRSAESVDGISRISFFAVGCILMKRTHQLLLDGASSVEFANAVSTFSVMRETLLS